jgi:hypothetical protein
MRSEYTIKKVVTYLICVMANDEDEAIEAALGTSFANWDSVEDLAEIIEVEPVAMDSRHVDY